LQLQNSALFLPENAADGRSSQLVGVPQHGVLELHQANLTALDFIWGILLLILYYVNIDTPSGLTVPFLFIRWHSTIFVQLCPGLFPFNWLMQHKAYSNL
jgi:hypothetical protein